MLRLTCFIVFAVAFTNTLPTKKDVARAGAAVFNILEANSRTVKYGFPPYEYKDYPFIAGFVRLAFHDCVGEGKCDGCINFNIKSNKGIDTYSTALDSAYDADPTHFGMSRGDFYASAAILALELSTSKMSNANERFDVRDKFRFGRQDCDSSPTTEAADNFPSPHDGFDITVKYFEQEFGFSPEETLALMGAHSLGRARLENSGFEGRWTNDLNEGPSPSSPYKLTPESTLDNQYYKEIDIPWKQLENPKGNFQWHTLPTIKVNDGSRRGDPREPTILLNSDFCFKWQYNGDPSRGGLIDCFTDCRTILGVTAPPPFSPQTTCCNRSPIISEFEELRDHNDKFIEKFGKIFSKMVNRQFPDGSGTLFDDLEDEKKDFLDKYSTGQLEELLDELMDKKE